MSSSPKIAGEQNPSSPPPFQKTTSRAQTTDGTNSLDFQAHPITSYHFSNPIWLSTNPTETRVNIGPPQIYSADFQPSSESRSRWLCQEIRNAGLWLPFMSTTDGCRSKGTAGLAGGVMGPFPAGGFGAAPVAAVTAATTGAPKSEAMASWRCFCSSASSGGAECAAGGAGDAAVTANAAAGAGFCGFAPSRLAVNSSRRRFSASSISADE